MCFKFTTIEQDSKGYVVFKKTNFYSLLFFTFIFGAALVLSIFGAFLWKFDGSCTKKDEGLMVAKDQEIAVLKEELQEVNVTVESCTDPQLNQDIHGHNLEQLSGTLDDCCQFCHENHLCKAYVWTSVKKSSKNGTCWLKSTYGPVNKHDGHIYKSFLGYKSSKTIYQPQNYTVEDLAEKMTLDLNDPNPNHDLTDKIIKDIAGYFLVLAKVHTTPYFRDNIGICKDITAKLEARYDGAWVCTFGEFEEFLRFEKPGMLYRKFGLDVENEERMQLVQIVKA